MGVEIERKFLLQGDAWRFAVEGCEGVAIEQGYLVAGSHRVPASAPPSASVRVRRHGDAACLTIKSTEPGLMRQEFEYPIPVEDADTLLRTLCASHVKKVRHAIPYGELMLELDVFQGENEGLVVVEVELPSLDTPFAPPSWFGPEVSHLERYSNASLSVRPYRSWTAAERECPGEAAQVPRFTCPRPCV